MRDVKLIIDGIERNGWKNPEDFSVKIFRDKDLNIIYPTYEGEMNFVGEIYNYLFTQFTENGFCNLIDAKLYYRCDDGSWRLFAPMKIALSDVSFNLDKCTATCQFIDNSFGAYINNNKSIPFEITTTITKNQQPIQNISNVAHASFNTIRECQLFIPETGLYSIDAGYCYGLHVYWVFNNLIAAMSDNLLRFRSDFFNTNGGGVQTFVTSGSSIRSGKQTPPTTTFEAFFTAMQKKYNLAMGFNTDMQTGVTEVRIEPVSFFENAVPSIQLLNQSGIIRSFDTSRLYATIDLGAEPFLEQWEPSGRDIADGGKFLTFPQIKFRGFKTESFGLLGTCNIDTTLNIRSEDVVFDTNVIEDIILNGNEGYEDTAVVIQAERAPGLGAPPPTTPTASAYRALRTDPLSLGQTVYNGTFTNNEVAGRWIGGVPNSIWSYYNGYNNSLLPFAANGTLAAYNESTAPFGGPGGMLLFPLDQTTDIATSPVLLTNRRGFYVPFDNEVLDPGTNYDNLASGYVCPFPMSATFNAQVVIYRNNSTPVGVVIWVRLVFDRYNANGQLIDRHRGVYTNYFGNFNAGPSFVISLSKTYVLNAGDQIYVNMEAYKSQPAAFATLIAFSAINTVLFPTFYNCTNTVSVSGGELEQADPADFRGISDRFTRPLSNAEMVGMINNTANAIGYTRSQSALNINKGFIDEVTINNALTKKVADFKLRTNDISMP